MDVLELLDRQLWSACINGARSNGGGVLLGNQLRPTGLSPQERTHRNHDISHINQNHQDTHFDRPNELQKTERATLQNPCLVQQLPKRRKNPKRGEKKMSGRFHATRSHHVRTMPSKSHPCLSFPPPSQNQTTPLLGLPCPPLPLWYHIPDMLGYQRVHLDFRQSWTAMSYSSAHHHAHTKPPRFQTPSNSIIILPSHHIHITRPLFSCLCQKMHTPSSACS